jgi:hypothetical protein
MSVKMGNTVEAEIRPDMSWDELWNHIDLWRNYTPSHPKYNKCRDEDDFNKGLAKGWFEVNLSYAAPRPNIIDALVDFIDNNRVLEVGAGLGLWARLLELRGVNIVATDAMKGSHYDDDKIQNRYCDVKRLTADAALEEYRGRNVLLLIWPSKQDSMAYDTLSSFTGHKLIFIGEERDGVTANEAFYDLLNSEWVKEDYMTYYSWPLSAKRDGTMLYDGVTQVWCYSKKT